MPSGRRHDTHPGIPFPTNLEEPHYLELPRVLDPGSRQARTHTGCIEAEILASSCSGFPPTIPLKQSTASSKQHAASPTDAGTPRTTNSRGCQLLRSWATSASGISVRGEREQNMASAVADCEEIPTHTGINGNFMCTFLAARGRPGGCIQRHTALIPGVISAGAKPENL